MGIETASTKSAKRAVSGLLACLCLWLANTARADGCTLGASSTPLAMLLPVTAASPQHIQVGTVLQDCIGTVSYTLVVTSANCLLSPAGAKLRDPISKEYVRYSVEFNNPTSGGSQPVVLGLLASVCANAVGRDVNRAKITHESSAIVIDFTGTAMLAAGTYSDTLTVTLNIH